MKQLHKSQESPKSKQNQLAYHVNKENLNTLRHLLAKPVKNTKTIDKEVATCISLVSSCFIREIDCDAALMRIRHHVSNAHSEVVSAAIDEIIDTEFTMYPSTNPVALIKEKFDSLKFKFIFEIRKSIKKEYADKYKTLDNQDINSKEKLDRVVKLFKMYIKEYIDIPEAKYLFFIHNVYYDDSGALANYGYESALEDLKENVDRVLFCSAYHKKQWEKQNALLQSRGLKC